VQISRKSYINPRKEKKREKKQQHFYARLNFGFCAFFALILAGDFVMGRLLELAIDCCLERIFYMMQSN